MRKLAIDCPVTEEPLLGANARVTAAFGQNDIEAVECAIHSAVARNRCRRRSLRTTDGHRSGEVMGAWPVRPRSAPITIATWPVNPMALINSNSGPRCRCAGDDPSHIRVPLSLVPPRGLTGCAEMPISA